MKQLADGKNWLFIGSVWVLCLFYSLGMAQTTWKVGLAKRIITPKEPMWMAGYANRNKPASGKIHELWAKAIVLEDTAGKKLVCVSTDLLGIPHTIEQQLCEQLERSFHLPRECIMLNSSHTHSAPVLAGALQDIYPVDTIEERKIITYSSWLVKELEDLIKEALADKGPAYLSIGSGFAQFQVNRRNNKESELKDLSALNGPNDFSVPIIKVTGADGKIKSILFSYACHATVLDGYDWSGDYVGFAQLELESIYQDCQAMFFQGAGADQNPLPRKSLGRARQYGKVLAAAVEQVIADDDFQALEPSLKVAFREIPLPLEKAPTKSELENLLQVDDRPDYMKKWAKRMLDHLNKGEVLRQSYSYPIQCVQLGKQLIFALGGELVTQYALDLKEAFGTETIVFGYSNDVMAYIPSERILKEGGYEGESSQVVYGLPAKWQQGIEQQIIDACKALHGDL